MQRENEELLTATELKRKELLLNQLDKQLAQHLEQQLAEKTDSELVDRFRNGDKLAFEELIGRYNEKAYNLAMRITRRQEDAEEILQDVFVSVFKKIHEFEGKSAFSSWLYRITVNTAFM